MAEANQVCPKIGIKDDDSLSTEEDRILKHFKVTIPKDTPHVPPPVLFLHLRNLPAEPVSFFLIGILANHQLTVTPF